MQVLLGVQAMDSNDCPVSDNLRAVCRVAFEIAQAGRFAEAIQLLHSVAPKVQGILKLEQRINGFVGLVKMIQCLHLGDLSSATYHRTQLLPLRDSNEPELDTELHFCEIELLIRRQELEKALDSVNKSIVRLKAAPAADVVQRLQFLLCKAKIFAAGGKPAKGLPIVMRAASMAERLRLVPVMIEAVLALAVILNDIAEFEAARDMVEAILPAAVENNRRYLNAELYKALAEAYVGIAGHRRVAKPVDQPAHRSHYLRIAESHIDSSLREYGAMREVHGQLEALSMKARLARYRGDEAVATQVDAQWHHNYAIRDKAINGHDVTSGTF